MSSRRDPEFEPSFGSRTTDQPLESRRRDRHASPGDDADGSEGGSISELIDTVGSRRTVGERQRPAQIPGDPMLVTHDPTPEIGGGPVVPMTRPRADGRDDVGDDTPSLGTHGSRRVGTRWFRVRRRLLVVCTTAVLAGLAYFAVSLFQVWSTGRSDSSAPADAIVVMGAAQYDGRPSPQLAARLDHVVEIWPQGIAPLVVVTGGNIPGDRFTEAEASFDYLVERGVPADSILMENEGSNSQESLTSVAEILTARGVDDVLIVTDPYHALRSRLIAQELGLDAHVSSTDTSVVAGADNLKQHVQEAGGVAIGRVIGFDRLSDLVD